jgi:nucleotide-binding universal stress UspA family protein
MHETKGDDMAAYKCILVPTDGTPLSLKAARAATALALDLKASIKAVYVMPPWRPPMLVEAAAVPAEVFDERAYNKATEASAKAALAKVEAIAARSRVKCETVVLRDHDPWKGIVKAAKKCDLIAMASHGRTGIEAAILGSETRKVLAHATKPVLVCH